jgi:hypothetical protein
MNRIGFAPSGIQELPRHFLPLEFQFLFPDALGRLFERAEIVPPRQVENFQLHPPILLHEEVHVERTASVFPDS